MEITSKEKILILEDDNGIATLEARKIRSLGFEPIIAHDTKSAFDILETENFHALLLDHNLGESINGIDFYNQLREKGDFTPAVLVTGLENPQILLNAIRAGIRDFVPKHENFLDDLASAIVRAVTQSKMEREASISSALKNKNDILESAIAAANLCYTKTVRNSPLLEFWEGKHKIVFGSDDVLGIRTREELLNVSLPEDKEKFKNAIIDAENSCGNFSIFIRFNFDPRRWTFVQGRCFPGFQKDPQSLILVFSDMSDQKIMENELVQSNMRITALNKRLQIGSIEAHHRIKNSLQNITSLLNLQTRKSGGLDLEGAQKLSSHIQALSKLHDILTEQVKDHPEVSSIDISQIIKEIADTIQNSIPSRNIQTDLDSVILPSKISCTISVIVNELLSNAIKHGNGDIHLSLKKNANKATLMVHNERSSFPDNIKALISGRNGLSVVEALSKGDLSSTPIYENSPNGGADAIINFSVEGLQ